MPSDTWKLSLALWACSFPLPLPLVPSKRQLVINSILDASKKFVYFNGNEPMAEMTKERSSSLLLPDFALRPRVC